MMTHKLTIMAMNFPMPIVRKGSRIWHKPGRMPILQSEHPETGNYIDIAYGTANSKEIDTSLLDMLREGGPITVADERGYVYCSGRAGE